MGAHKKRSKRMAAAIYRRQRVSYAHWQGTAVQRSCGLDWETTVRIASYGNYGRANALRYIYGDNAIVVFLLPIYVYAYSTDGGDGG